MPIICIYYKWGKIYDNNNSIFWKSVIDNGREQTIIREQDAKKDSEWKNLIMDIKNILNNWKI